jgi:hypothetical protein
MSNQTRTRLDSLVRQRLLTRKEACEALSRRAGRMGLSECKFALSERQFYRLLLGEVKTRPHPVVCRVIEAEFGCSIDELLAREAVEPLRRQDSASPYELGGARRRHQGGDGVTEFANLTTDAW